MKNKDYIGLAVKKYSGSSLRKCKLLGKGANGEVYRVKIDREPYILAVKATQFPEILEKEADALNYINDRADIMLPKVLFHHSADGEIPLNIMGMTYLDGVSADKINWKLVPRGKRDRFRKDVVDNIVKLREVTNDKFGYIDNPIYANWLDFYIPFAKARLEYLRTGCGEGSITRYVEKVLTRAFENLETILADCGKPTLTHGDYWLPNLIVDKRTKRLVGCVDPFNVMYADCEYELFTLMQFPGLGLYDLYTQNEKVSKFCDLKSRVYALFSEVYWCQILNHSVERLFIKEMAKLCGEELDKAQIIIQKDYE